MKINFNLRSNLSLKHFIVAAVFSSLSVAATAGSKINNSKAPEATAAEAKLSFRDTSVLEKAYIDPSPAIRKDKILVGKLFADGRKAKTIIKLAKEIADKKHGNYDSLLIAHKDKLIFESYYLRGRVNLPHPQASAVKTYTSLVVGRAIQMGYLNLSDLHKPLVSFLKELDPTKFTDGAEKITLHKALIMHGGLNVNREEWEALEKATPGKLKGQGLVQTLLEKSKPITAESQTYLYGNYNPMLVMTVIDAVVPGTAQEFIKNEILDKLSITNYSWDTHISGLPQAGWLVSMTSRDMLKLGSLVLNKGKWNGEQLISANYLTKATSGLVKPTDDWMPESYRYGYFWYQAPLAVEGKNYDATFAWGGGGQRVIVVAELDLTIVITAHDRDDKIMTQIENAVLPVFAK
jgi:CubicO group peptidase (beta-lactamase class C family)